MKNEIIIHLSDLTFSWSSSEPACINLESLDIHQGERVFLYGPSGSGKSTLLGLLTGVLTPNSGTICMLDKNLTELSNVARDKFRAHHIGFIFQQFNLIPYLSVIDNVLLPCHFSSVRKNKIIQKGIGPNEEAKELLIQLDIAEPLHHRVASNLSVGQQQRVAAARALIGQPEIIIADEPTSALDENRQKAFLELLLKQCDSFNATLIFVSHDHRLKSLFPKHISLPDLNKVAEAEKFVS